MALASAFPPSNYMLTRFQFKFLELPLHRTPTKLLLGLSGGPPKKQGAPAAESEAQAQSPPSLGTSWVQTLRVAGAGSGAGPWCSGQAPTVLSAAVSGDRARDFPEEAVTVSGDRAQDFPEEAVTALALPLTQRFVFSERFRLH